MPTEANLARARAFDWDFNTHGDPALKSLFAEVGKFAASLPDSGWLSVFGTSGCGKTHLGKKLVRFWNRYHVRAARRVAYAVFARWGTVMREKSEGKLGLVDWMGAAGLLVIDDIGAESAGTSHRQQESRAMLQEVLDIRAKEPTFITSNMDFDEFHRIDPRLSSRLTRNGSVFQSTAPDYQEREDLPEPEKAQQEAPESVSEPFDGNIELTDPELMDVAERITRQFNVPPARDSRQAQRNAVSHHRRPRR